MDDRVATVVAGTWYIGYGDRFATTALKALPPGSFYTEPAIRTHFAETRDEPVIVQITGIGPSSTHYVDPASDPRRGAGTEPSKAITKTIQGCLCGPAGLKGLRYSDNSSELWG
jgi:hypothetical protein